MGEKSLRVADLSFNLSNSVLEKDSRVLYLKFQSRTDRLKGDRGWSGRKYVCISAFRDLLQSRLSTNVL